MFSLIIVCASTLKNRVLFLGKKAASKYDAENCESLAQVNRAEVLRYSLVYASNGTGNRVDALFSSVKELETWKVELLMEIACICRKIASKTKIRDKEKTLMGSILILFTSINQRG
jgi:hypothetical protein